MGATGEPEDPSVEQHGSHDAHELLRVFAAHGLPLNSTLVEMLSEHHSHRTERRGCGYTQSTRHLAVLVNRARGAYRETIAKLFPGQAPTISDAGAAVLQQTIRGLSAELELEESQALVRIIADLVLPNAEGAPALPPFFGELKVGTCPLAEKYFLEIADGFVRRKGRVNVLVSDAGAPLLLEKINLGDAHSCVSVTELILNGVRLPPGCLFGVDRRDDVELRPNRVLPGSIIPVERVTGLRFLRLTTLAISTANRRRAFTTHFQAQLDAGLYAPGQATIDQLRRVAEGQL